MKYNFINIPDDDLSKHLNNYIKQSEQINIVSAFVFKAGLNLIINNLKDVSDKSKINFITSNYKNCTQPEALELLLELKNSGAKVYFYDSKNSNGFHIKLYSFMKTKTDYKTIVGSSNLSKAAMRENYETNLLVSEKKTYEDSLLQIKKIIDDENCKLISEEIITEYKNEYDESNNIFISENIEKNSNNIHETFYKEPNIVQNDALEILQTNRELGVKKGLVVMATGLGKTILAALDAKNFKSKKLLFIAHREEILKQSYNSFNLFFDKKDFGYYQGKLKEINKNFIFASIQTIGRKNELNKFEKEQFDYIIVDEFHHAGAKSYTNLLNYFKPSFFLGLTATPNRTDNKDILKYLDNNLIYQKDLIDGINLELLSNFEYHGIHDKYVDYTKITWKGKKFDEVELDANLMSYKRAEYIFNNWNKYKLTRTLAFCSSISHAEFMSKFFQNKNINAIAVHSKSNLNREESINKLKNNEVDIIFSVDLFNEGIDIPVVDTILMARPTESKIIFLQQLGRGLRKAHGKSIVNIIDFIGNHKSFLEKPSALFGFDLNHNNLREFIKNYKDNKLNLPSKSRIYYDVESISFMEEIIKTKIDIETKYNEFKNDNGRRPSASDFFQFIDKLSNLRLQYSSWFQFVERMGDLNHIESKALLANLNFYKDIEKTKMTKSFKMVVLDLLNKNNFNNYDINKLCKDSFDYLKNTTSLWNEIKPEFKVKKLDENLFPKWKKYWLDNPINALINNSSSFYKLKDEKLVSIINKENISIVQNFSKELIEFRFISYKTSYDLSYVSLGDINKPIEEQLGKSFNKTDVPKVFNFRGKAAQEGYYKMFGHAIPPNVPHQFIFITLIKSSLAVEHRYHDYFISDELFHWQSRNSTTQNNEAGLSIINHKIIKKDIHLFVRKIGNFNGKALPFTYCGKMNFLKVKGNRPINVEFKLIHPLANNLKEEFLRV